MSSGGITGAVEALKDKGNSRWDGVLKSNFRSNTHPLSASSSSAISNNVKQSKESLQRKVMELNCWGPTTVRF